MLLGERTVSHRLILVFAYYLGLSDSNTFLYDGFGKFKVVSACRLHKFNKVTKQNKSRMLSTGLAEVIYEHLQEMMNSSGR